MPQLEQIDTYTAQLIWMVIVFTGLYLIMVKIALPRIGAALEGRQARIDADLERASALKEEADGGACRLRAGAGGGPWGRPGNLAPGGPGDIGPRRPKAGGGERSGCPATSGPRRAASRPPRPAPWRVSRAVAGEAAAAATERPESGPRRRRSASPKPSAPPCRRSRTDGNLQHPRILGRGRIRPFSWACCSSPGANS